MGPVSSSPAEEKKSARKSEESEICYVRFLYPPGSMESIAGPLLKEAEKIEGFADAVIKKRLLSPFKDEKKETTLQHGARKNNDEGSSVESMLQSMDESNKKELLPFDGWFPRYKISIREFQIEGQKKKELNVSFFHKGRKKEKVLLFETESGAKEFCAIIEKNKKMQDIRSKRRLGNALGGIKLESGEELTFLIDICSGTDIPRSDIGKNSDPMVSVWFNGVKIHQTDYIPNTEDPIWTLRRSSLFLWKVPAIDLFKSEDCLIFEVEDFDLGSSSTSLGAFNVSAKTLYHWNGERREFALKSLLGEKDFGKGKVALRVRRATEDDIDFMEKYERSKNKKREVPTLLQLKGGKGTIASVTTVYKKKAKEGPDQGKEIYLVRPGPDPKRKDSTTWLTKEKIEEESMAESRNWIDIGSGNLGKIFLEIIGCDGLPNMDTGGAFGNKTDAFVSIVHEDCMARTDVIADTLSPRFMPWSQRAFIFNVMRTSSQLFLAVFDSDSNPFSQHDFIGRVSVDLSNFRNNTVYILIYNLYKTAKCEPRRGAAPLGSIKIRLRLELEDERTLLLSNFELPASVYVNVESKKDFNVIHKTVVGNVDLKRYGLGNINSYVNELWSYLVVYYFLEDAFVGLLLWRGRSNLTLPVPLIPSFTVQWKHLTFPLHSIAAFLIAISVVENPDLLPSVSFGCIGWLLVATSEKRSKNPNPWIRSKSFGYFLLSLILGKHTTGPQSIEPNENVDAIEANSTSWMKRVKDAEEKANQRAIEYAKEQEEYWSEIESLGDGDISTKAGLFTIDPTRVYLYPVQEWLGIICDILRVVRNVIVWEEPHYSFIIAFGSFILAFVLYFLPWGYLIKWTLRVVAWVIFGPWMMLADKFYFSKLESETDEQKMEREGNLRLARRKQLENQLLEAQIRREKAEKLKDFKQFMFGQFVSKVNITKLDRSFDIPLPESSATPYTPKSLSLGELAMEEAGYRRTRINGQQLVGDMIPTLFETPSTEAPLGKATKKTALLKGGSPGVQIGNDSYVAAAIKVGSIVLSAGAVTWFGIPLLVYFVGFLFPGNGQKL